MIRCLIIEDEPLAANRLEGMLLTHHSDVEVVGRLDSVKSSVQYLEHHGLPDLIFMDIELADGNSFLVFEEVEITVPIVFTTAYEQFSLKAFEQNSLDYLLKPVKQKDLKRSLDKFRSLGQASKKLIAEAAPNSQFKERFLGRIGNKLYYKKSNEISLFYSEDKITYMIGKDRKKFIIDYPLDKLEKELLDPYSFYRISRKHIVNADAVSIIKTYINQRLSLELNIAYEHPVIVSREKVNDFKSWLNR